MLAGGTGRRAAVGCAGLIHLEPDGELWLTQPDSIKGRLVTAARRFSMCVTTEDYPHAYVSVERAVTITLAERPKHERRMAHRYLCVEQGDQYVAAGAERPGAVRLTMRPERWWTVDYAKAT